MCRTLGRPVGLTGRMRRRRHDHPPDCSPRPRRRSHGFCPGHGPRIVGRGAVTVHQPAADGQGSAIGPGDLSSDPLDRTCCVSWRIHRAMRDHACIVHLATGGCPGHRHRWHHRQLPGHQQRWGYVHAGQYVPRPAQEQGLAFDGSWPSAITRGAGPLSRRPGRHGRSTSRGSMAASDSPCRTPSRPHPTVPRLAVHPGGPRPRPIRCRPCGPPRTAHPGSGPSCHRAVRHSSRP